VRKDVALLSNGVNRAVQAWKPMDGQVHPAGGTWWHLYSTIRLSEGYGAVRWWSH